MVNNYEVVRCFEQIAGCTIDTAIPTEVAKDYSESLKEYCTSHKLSDHFIGTVYFKNAIGGFVMPVTRVGWEIVLEKWNGRKVK